MNIQDLIEQYVNSDKLVLLEEKLCVSEEQKLHLKGLVGSGSAMLASAVYTKNSKKNHVFVLPDEDSAKYFQSDLDNIIGGNIHLFPASFKKSFDFTLEDSDQVLQRAEALSALSKVKNKGVLLVTYPEALVERVMSVDTLRANTLEIVVGSQLGIDFIAEFLTSYDFEREDFVYKPGQFSVRGGIVDIFSFSNDHPYRIEFMGDEVESLRMFDIETQISVAQLNTITIVPNVQSQQFDSSKVSFFDFLQKENTIFWIKDVSFALELVKDGVQKAIKIWESLPKVDKEQNPQWQNPAQYLLDSQTFTDAVARFSVIEFGKRFFYKASTEIQFDQKPQPSFNKDFSLLAHNLEGNKQNKIENLVFSDSPKQIERIYALLEDAKKGGLFIPINTALHEGFLDQDILLACYTDHQIFNRFFRYKHRKSFGKSAAVTLKELRELKPGDYITHMDHGIGKYAGLETIDVNGHLQEMIRLVYSDNDLLYVNINSLNRIAKYTGQDGAIPKMSRLGSDAWEKLKKSTKKKVKDIARELIKLYAQRKAKKGNAFSADSYLQHELEASFMYEDTPDQLKSTLDVKRDMESPHPMDRLVCGDVGFGKTEVAIRAAFKAVADSKQVAILVPTTILALQHFKTFSSRLKDLPCKIDYINRFKTTGEIKKTLKEVEEGKIDILIGTHRIVSKDVKFKDLGLLIIDEEQKFGVSTKEKLKQMRVNVDTLTLTATPIPRTLHFSLMGARDLSIINTPPPNRQPVETEMHVFNEVLIKEAIERELERGGQVFFVHNRVADIEQYASLITKLVPDAKVGIGHGQMDGEHLENVMINFINGEYDVLVATTIIEAGLDIPNANTIIINHAHMFGLSDLHQMRGRVGRSNKKAYCYLLSPPLSTLTHDARKRLSAIEEFSDLGSGFNVAMRDLDIRGSGNLLGAEQSGFIAEIGFEMYHKILDEAIQELKDEEFKEVFADAPPREHITFTQIDTDFEMLIPADYVTNVGERYNLYSELSKIEDEVRMEQFEKMLADRFGAIPSSVYTMMDAVRLQWLGKKIGFEKIVLKKGLFKGYFVADQQSLYFDSNEFGAVLKYVQQFPTRCSLKEVKGSLRLSVNDVANINEAKTILNEMLA